MNHKLILIIMDGWGHGTKDNTNAIYKANTPFVDSLYKKYPNAELLTHEENVGLPGGQMGNSEVGHLNIGAGRIVYQEFTRINKEIENGDFFTNKILKNAIDNVKKNNSCLHLMGLVSDGGVHSHIRHLDVLIDMAVEYEIKDLFINAFLDGRDVPPRSAIPFLDEGG